MRSKLLGLDLAMRLWRDRRYASSTCDRGLDTSTLPWAGSYGPGLVESDGPATHSSLTQAESAGCPSDGADVAPWLDREDSAAFP